MARARETSQASVELNGERIPIPEELADELTEASKPITRLAGLTDAVQFKEAMPTGAELDRAFAVLEEVEHYRSLYSDAPREGAA